MIDTVFVPPSLRSLSLRPNGELLFFVFLSRADSVWGKASIIQKSKPHLLNTLATFQRHSHRVQGPAACKKRMVTKFTMKYQMEPNDRMELLPRGIRFILLKKKSTETILGEKRTTNYQHNKATFFTLFLKHST